MEDKIKRYEKLRIRLKELNVVYHEIDLGDMIIFGVDLSKITSSQQEEIFKIEGNEIRDTSKIGEQ